MVEKSADKSYELCLINIHVLVSTCLWKTTVVCLGMSYGGVIIHIPRVICYKLVLKSVSYLEIVKNTLVLIQQGIACNVYNSYP